VLRYGPDAGHVADLRLPAAATGLPGERSGAPLVAGAVDALPGLVVAAAEGRVDARRVILAGHSAGGHLALWAAARRKLPATAPWHAATEPASGVGLAAVSDLVARYRQRLGSGAVEDLLGGGPADRPERYALADPSQLLPTGVPVRLVHGSDDSVVPCSMSLDYITHAHSSGDDAACAVPPGSGHFAVIDPRSAAWPDVVAAFQAIQPVDHR
jgi:pimeloyl-ACP methyl ester carboxylesterase